MSSHCALLKARPAGAAVQQVLARWLTVAFLLGVACAAVASESAPTVSPRAVVTLVSESAAVVAGQTVRVGLRQKLAPHWHTYWKNPGDAGAPPEVTLHLPVGSTRGEMQWPGPDRLAFGPLVNFGYENQIVFPVPVTVPAALQPGETFVVRADASWLVCEHECIPEQGSFELRLPVGTRPVPAAAEVAAAFGLADARLPSRSPWAARLALEGQALALSLRGEGLSADSVKQAFFFPAAWGAIENAAPQALVVEQGQLSLVMTRGPALDMASPVAGLLAVTGVDGTTRWLDISAVVTDSSGTSVPAADAATASQPAAIALWQAALFAFLGGLILNLMPCVFPVLAIKATSVAQLSGGPLREVRLAGLFYTVGVLTAFAALAAALLAVRAGGTAVGWGFQFQTPWFVMAMAWLLLAIGLNMSGVYEIGGRLAGAGQSLTAKRGHQGSFFTGLLAVVVATPCTAPFMGAALGAALAAPPLTAMGLFLAMGCGLALPYALLGVFPQAARWLPRPGGWMLLLRQGMAFLMYASAAWLIWVLSRQAGDTGVLAALAGAVLIGLAAWLYGLAQQGVARPWLAHGASVLVLLGTVALLPLLSDERSAANVQNVPHTGGRTAAAVSAGF
ncbi:MAG TPA: protein-disulfide reductase DsbD domain-containing protein, partial [Rubrivivax sp.]|nr:protein-disulfide reductase DsbD domain-containing protein [Rubrivivax sp.]